MRDLLLAAAALLLLAGPSADERKGNVMTASRTTFEGYLARLPLTASQRDMLTLIAYGESHFNLAAHNDSAGEVAASWRAYRRVDERLAGCGFRPEDYAIGSGGYFGRLVPYFADDLRGVVPCVNPQAVFSNAAAVFISGIRNCGRLQRYQSWRDDPTAVRLRAGFLSLRAMADVPPDRAQKYARHAREAGLPPTFINGRVDVFPVDDATLRDWYARLGGV